MVTAAELNLRHLDALLAVGRKGSISAASAAVNLSQPALTQAMAKIEESLGRTLFDRQPGGAVPNAAGAMFLARVERSLEQIVEAGRGVRRSARLPAISHLERIASMAQLRALAAVERAGSYALAAREIGLSQPSLHRAVKEFELVLDTPLLVRTARRMRATAAAERMVRAIRLAMSELQAGIDELSALDLTGAGRIVIGSLPLPRAALLPHALARFAPDHPHARIQVVEGPYAELVSSLRDGEIDLMLGALRDPAPASDLVQRPLFTDDLSIVARARHPLAGPDMPGVAALAAYPWVVGAAGSPMRRRWEGLFAPRQDLPAVQVDCGSVVVTRGMLLDGDWLALLSPDQFRIERTAGLIVPIGPPVPGSRREIGITTRADWRPTPTQARLIDTLDAVADERLQEFG
jgi:LysR family transcriptional regulator of gallate degradation